MTGDKDEGRQRATIRPAQRPELRARPVRPAALADPCPARAISRDRGRRARDPPVAGRRNRRCLARLCRGLEPAAGVAADRRQRREERPPHPAAPQGRHRSADRSQPGPGNPGAGAADLAQQRTRSRRTSMRCSCWSGRRLPQPAAGVDRAGGRDHRRASRGLELRRPAAPARRASGRISASRRQCRHRRGAGGAVPQDHPDRPARLCEQRADQPVHRRRLRLERRARTPPTRSSRPAPATPTSA